MTQLFQNLISNAIKYAKPGTRPTVHLRAIDEGSMWKFALRDEGIGIEPAWISRIFQTDAASEKSSGPWKRELGLATCKKLVTRAGGDIWAESSFGAGATFFFTLPRMSD